MTELPFLRGRNIKLAILELPHWRVARVLIGAAINGECTVIVRTYASDERGFAEAAEMPGKTLEWQASILDGRIFGQRMKVKACTVGLDVGMATLSETEAEAGLENYVFDPNGARKDAAMYVFRLVCTDIKTVRDGDDVKISVAP